MPGILLRWSYFMETEILGHKSPLYGRRTGEWSVKPLMFRHVKEFFSNYDTADLFRIWAMCGGVPYYIQKLDPSLTIEKNIKQNILTRLMGRNACVRRVL